MQKSRLTTIALTAALAACSTPSVAPPTQSVPLEMNRASSTSLLYVTAPPASGIQGDTSIFAYPAGKLVRRFTVGGFVGCSDRRGNVYFLNSNPINGLPQPILKYAHGGTSPIAEYALPAAGNLFGCAVSPKGELAVPVMCTYSASSGCTAPGYVAIFKNSTAPPTVYHDPKLSSLYGWCTYDDAGNLYVDGLSIWVIGVLPHGSSTFRNVVLRVGESGFTSLQWDGKYLAAWVPNAGIVRLAIKGTHASIVQEIPIEGASAGALENTFLLDGSTALVPGGSEIFFFHYPGGGPPYRKIVVPWGSPAQLAVSMIP